MLDELGLLSLPLSFAVFDSTVDVGRTTYFWLPLSLLITDKYDNERNIRLVTAPVLILHGEQDAVIPMEMGLRVYRAANEPKRIELSPTAPMTICSITVRGTRRNPF